MEKLEQRYSDPTVNRQYWLADALIQVRSYSWGLVDKVASDCSDAEIAAFHKIITALNNAK